MSNTEHDSSGRFFKGVFWVVLTRFLMRIIGTVSTLIMVRLLMPEDFGLVAVGFTLLEVLRGMSDFGAAQVVIKFRDADKSDYDTIWSLTLVRGIIISLILVGLAYPAGVFYEDMRYQLIFYAIAIIPFLEGAMNPRFHEFERNMDFRRELIVLGANKFLSVAVAIAFAVIFRNYWALVVGTIVGTVLQLFLTYYFVPYKPVFNFNQYKKILGFSGWLAGVGFMNSVNLKLDSIFLAKIFGTSLTGSYSLGIGLAQLPTNEIANPIGRVLFPHMSGQQDNLVDMQRTCIKAAQGMAAIISPIAFGLAFVAQDLVRLLTGDLEVWSGVVPVLQYVTPCLGLYYISSPIYQFAMAQGKTKLLFYRELLFFLFRVPLFIYIAVHYGFVAAVATRAASALVQMIMNLFIYQKVSGRFFLEPLIVCWRSILALTAMFVWFVGFEDFLPQIPDAFFGLRLLVDTLVGGIIYLTTHFGLWMAVGRPSGIEHMVWQKAAAGFSHIYIKLRKS